MYTFAGEVTAARDPAMVGMPVRIVAEVDGTTGVKIALGTHTFKGAGLVVIAIIAILSETPTSGSAQSRTTGNE